MGVDADHFVAGAVQGDLVDPVVDVAKVQVEGLGQALDLLGDLEKLGVLVLRHTVDVEGGNGHQFTQGLGGGLAVLHPGVEAQQAMDFVLLFGGQALVVEKGADGRAQVGVLARFALGQAAEELTEVADRVVTEGLEDGRALLRGDIGLGGAGKRGQAGEHQGGRSQVLERKIHC